jgi:hypothetical protein
MSDMEFEKSPQTYGNHQAPAHYEPGEGCLTTVIRIPVRIVVLLVVVPVRMVWDLLVVCGRAVERMLLRPLGRAMAWVYEAVLTPLGHGLVWLGVFIGKALFVWPWVALWRYLVVPVVTYGLVVPVVWIYRQLLTPLGHGLAWLLTAIGHGIAAVCGGVWAAVVWLVVVLLVTPVGWVYRHILAPIGREIAAAVGVAWRIAGYISRAVGRGIKWLAWNLVGRPVRWCYQNVCTPVGHALRDGIWRPAKKAAVEAGRATRAALQSARETVRQARRDTWRALVGGPRVPEAGEPLVPQARTLGSTTTVPGAVAAPEISLRKQG